MSINIAIDGPSGAGKSTMAKAIAAKMGYVYVNTGELYRAVALYMLRNNADIQNDDEVIGRLPEVNIRLEFKDGDQQVLLGGEEVTQLLHTPEVSMGASRVSAIPAVRSFLFDLQKELASRNNAVMDGRDIGTVVLPNADVKIFLTASAEQRAMRRYKELSEKGDPSTYEEVLEDMRKRDYNDSHRETAPLKKADDAIELDTTELDLEQSVQAIFDVISSKLAQNTQDTEKKTADAVNTVNAPSRRDQIDFSGIRPVTSPRKQNPVKVFFYGILRVIVTCIYKIKYDFTIEGKENVPKTGSNIIASNHRSYRDPVFGALGVRVPCSFMAKEELFHGNPFFVWLIKFMGAFPVTRGSGDMSVITTAVEKLEEGRNVMIFPEGTRSKDGKLGRGKTGVALIAALAQVPVIPMAISFKGEKLKKFRQKVIISYGKPIMPDEIKLETSSVRDVKKIKQKIMDSIAVMVDENVNKL